MCKTHRLFSSFSAHCNHFNSSPGLHDLIAGLHRCSLAAAEQIHARLVTAGHHASPFAASALISLYSRLSLPFLSLSVFLSAPLPNPPSLFVYNSLIAALSSNSLPSLALHYFHRLRSHPSLRPDRFTFPCAIKACADLAVEEELRKIHASIVRSGLDSDVFVASAVVHAYLKFGRVFDAETMFDELPERDVVLWNAMVTGLAQLGEFARAMGVFELMMGDGVVPSRYTVTGVLSVFTGSGDLWRGKMIHGFVVKVGYHDGIEVCNALIDLYGKCEEADDAAQVFGLMSQRDIYSWNSMISACESTGDHVKSLRLFARMRRNGVYPDSVSVSAVLPACAQVAALAHGREIHALMITSGMRVAGEDVFADNALMDMYGKSGAMEDAWKVFDGMPRRDTASWNILIAAHAAHGLGHEALELFDAMCVSGVAPDEVTFVGVLSACSHAGMVGPGKEILKRMRPDFGVEPEAEHFVCAVDMLGRAGLLDEAREVAEMAEGSGGEAASWRAYMSACSGEAKRAEEAAEKVVGMEPNASGGWVMLANAYGRAGRYGEVAAVRGEMRQKSVRKTPGCSWVEISGGGVHVFVTGDRQHPATEAIYEAMHGLFAWLRECGWVPDAADEYTTCL